MDYRSAEQRHRYEVFRKGLAGAAAHDQGMGILAERHSPGELARVLATLLDGVAVQVVFAPDQWPASEQRRVVDGYLESLAAPITTWGPTSRMRTRK